MFQEINKKDIQISKELIDEYNIDFENIFHK